VHGIDIPKISDDGGILSPAISSRMDLVFVLKHIVDELLKLRFLVSINPDASILSIILNAVKVGSLEMNIAIKLRAAERAPKSVA
jgi:hypothetical protein